MHKYLMPSRIPLRYYAASLCGALLSLNSLYAQQTYEWGFGSGSLTPDLNTGIFQYAGQTESITTFGITDGITVPHINGKPASYLSVPQMPDGSYGYTVEFTNSAANGGGLYINQYTVAFDILIPGPANWVALLNTNANNDAGNDADAYISPDSAFGIGTIGYSSPNAFSFDQWHRLVISADLGSGDMRFFIDGVKVLDRDGGSLRDGRFSLFSNQDPGADLRLFNEGDNSGNYTRPAYLSAFAFADRALSDAEVALLGGPNAGGIFVPEPSTAALLLGSLGFAAIRRRKPFAA